MSNDFRAASEWLESSLATVGIIHSCGSVGRDKSIESAYNSLERLNNDYVEHVDVIEAQLYRLAELSDGEIERFDGRKKLVRFPKYILPQYAHSAHEIALCIARFALETFFHPLFPDSLEGEQRKVAEHCGANLKPLSQEQQWELACNLLRSHYHTLEMSVEEIALLQAKIRRERAKHLGNPTYLPAELPSECAKRIGRSLDTLHTYIRDGKVRCIKETKRSWRLHRDDVKKFGGKLD